MPFPIGKKRLSKKKPALISFGTQTHFFHDGAVEHSLSHPATSGHRHPYRHLLAQCSLSPPLPPLFSPSSIAPCPSPRHVT